MQRGDIYLVNYEPSRKGELGKKRRPSLIIQSNDAMEILDSVTVIPFSSEIEQNDEIFVLIEPLKTNGLSKPSVALCSHIYTIGKERLLKKIGSLPKQQFNAVLQGVLLHLDVDLY